MRLPWPRPIEAPLSAAEIDELLRETFGSVLGDRAFEQINRRSWVRSRKTPIREAVGIASLKGYSFMPGWSISLDFVPHVTTSGRIAWHRTAEQHRADLGVDPLDDPERLPADRLMIRGMGRRDAVHRGLKRSAAIAVDLAEAWFSRISDVASLIPLFEEAERQCNERFGFDNYVQHRLAFAFVLARTGDLDRARAELDRWCERHISVGFELEASRRSSLRGELHALLDAAVE